MRFRSPGTKDKQPTQQTKPSQPEAALTIEDACVIDITKPHSASESKKQSKKLAAIYP
jgi:hypothetical protein